jgi:hypothetical protein
MFFGLSVGSSHREPWYRCFHLSRDWVEGFSFEYKAVSFSMSIDF